MTEKNLAVLGGALLLIIGVMNVSDATKRSFTFNNLLQTWGTLIVGALLLWKHL